MPQSKTKGPAIISLLCTCSVCSADSVQLNTPAVAMAHRKKIKVGLDDKKKVLLIRERGELMQG